MTLISNLNQWQKVLRQQKEKNIRQWLAALADTGNLADFIANNYEHLLHSIEAGLEDPIYFDLVFQMIQKMYLMVVGYGDDERWLSYLKKALAMSEALERLVERGQLLEQVGNLVWQMSEPELAKHYYQQGIAQYEALNDQSRKAKLLLKNVQLIASQGHYREALAFYGQVGQLLETLPPDETMAFAHLTAAGLYRQIRNEEQALAEAAQANQLYTESGDSTRAITARLSMVQSLVALTRWDELEQLLPPIVAHLELNKDLIGLMRLHNSLGITAYKQQNYRLAERHWQISYNFCLQSQEKGSMPLLYNNLGKVYTALHEWAAAEAMLYQAVGWYQQLGDGYQEANSWDNLADLYEMKGDMGELVAALRQGIAVLEKADDLPHIVQLMQRMRVRWEAIGGGN